MKYLYKTQDMSVCMIQFVTRVALQIRMSPASNSNFEKEYCD